MQDSLSLREGNSVCSQSMNNDILTSSKQGVLEKVALLSMMTDYATECRYATPQILNQLLAGESDVDVEDWQAHTLYKNCSEDNHVVKWFWEVLQGYSQRQLQALLAFVTCSPVPPAGHLPFSLAF